MLLASSIRYGGILVEAADCDYTSFKHLGLLCPICKRSVFLVGAKQRSTHTRKNKAGELISIRESTVSSYFAHHPEVDRSTVDDCELRSSKITQIQRQQAELISRNQRRKILQNHFWKICKTSLNLLDPERIPVILEQAFVAASARHPLASKKMFDLLIGHLCDRLACTEQLTETKQTLEQGMRLWRLDILSNPHRCGDAMREALTLWGQTLDLKMQVAIVSEAFDFVSQKMQRPILGLLVCTALYKWLVARALCDDAMTLAKRLDVFNAYSMPVTAPDPDLDEAFGANMLSATRELIGMDTANFVALLGFVRDDVAQSLSTIDWAGEFERLDDRALAIA